METTRSEALFKEAAKFIPGGVNSPVRACGSVGGSPLFIQKAEGSKIIDADGNVYIDYVGSWGPMILGHRHPDVVKALIEALASGTSFGAPTALETRLSQLVVEAVPSVEKVRMVNSGTEATMSAVRLARGYTGRDIIIKFDGGYHGHADTLLVAAGSGVATLNIPGSPGIPESVSAHTLSITYNDGEAVKRVMAEKGDRVAAIIVEPVAGNMGMVPPVKGFHETLRTLCTKHGALLIFDEVMTGFRVAKGSGQGLFGITPDLTCFGKIIGGGLPVGAYGGRREIMDQIAPAGPVYQAGTLSGNPLAMAAGIATLEALKKTGFYESLDAKTERLVTGLRTAAEKAGIDFTASHVGSMAGMFFTRATVTNFDEAKTSDLVNFSKFYTGMRDRGIYLAPSQFEALFVSAAHTNDEIDATIAAAADVMAGLV
ncbi:HemL [Desulforapulum autotrophicum HRM2]|uniref:Glutamate-1-semialdehyde 2,1-aminomutase n=1 Tax=Desulforapulum autotrophicum (strain ATCC 43914 / DSM 3382 / VKM B-1955 / HRM2) TaxID=177437 RepID=GSA_DESAH|nr:glutamate-1-semialdehyde 2,1-aminomutase [Desulforapulum autotrophicum]C0QCR9.1 RecName: Full=Glutamate-1-semialdehyde 2,1-aminomutase; Short=GSA; AltName: Full=Glutamate-1-semialdehyde aminotransferase; Short=GSA-AT [Desulforapulum autotrophicum HRM2]ACN15146.1 HemL [Desulforapulum autotrophicum HRM2]